MSVGDGVADCDEGVEQLNLVERPGCTALSLIMKGPCRLRQCAAPNEAHGVERLIAAGPLAQFVDRYDAGMFELAGDLGFFEKACPLRRGICPLGTQFLEGHLSAQGAVAGQPDLADAALGV